MSDIKQLSDKHGNAIFPSTTVDAVEGLSEKVARLVETSDALAIERGRIDNMEDTINTLEENYENINDKINNGDSLGDNSVAINAKINSLEKSVDNLEDNYTVINGKVNTMETNINTLNNRYTSINNKVNNISQDENTVIIEPTGSDDTELLQNILDSGKNILSKPNQTYTITHPLYLTTKNQCVDLRGSKINFTQDQNNPHSTGNIRTNHIGIFNIRGNIQGSPISVISADIKNGEIELSSVDNVLIGDWVQLKLSCYGTVYNESYLSPTWNTLSRVLMITGNKITIEYSCDQWDIPSSDITGSVTVVKPLIGCTIKNMVIFDYTPLRNGHVTSGSVIYPLEDSHYACAGIGIENAVNCNIENITHNNGLFTTVHSTYLSHSNIKNIQTNTPKLIGGGEGYSIQCIDCFDINIMNIYGYRTRHTIDVSGGGYIKFKNIQSIKSPVSDVQFHGKYEHNIVIDGLRGSGDGGTLPYVNAGSGTSFGNASACVTFKNSEFIFISSMEKNFIKDLLIDNCNVILHRATGQVKITNSDVNLDQFILKIPITRGQKTYMEINNCNITMNSNQSIALYQRLSITNSDIRLTTKTDTELGLYIENCGDINISGNKINACLWLSNDDTTYGIRYTSYSITGNNIECFRYGGIFFKDKSKSCVVASITGNVFYNSRNYTGLSTPYAIDFDGNSIKDSTLKVIITGNIADNGNIFNSWISKNPNASCIIENNIFNKEI